MVGPGTIPRPVRREEASALFDVERVVGEGPLGVPGKALPNRTSLAAHDARQVPNGGEQVVSFRLPLSQPIARRKRFDDFLAGLGDPPGIGKPGRGHGLALVLVAPQATTGQPQGNDPRPIRASLWWRCASFMTVLLCWGQWSTAAELQGGLRRKLAQRNYRISVGQRRTAVFTAANRLRRKVSAYRPRATT